ncbi:hypothetical protein HispidOSU_012636, partial [Sigmodon hispidus]
MAAPCLFQASCDADARASTAAGRRRAGPGPHSRATVGGGLAPRSQRAPGFLLPARLHPCTRRAAGSGAKAWGGLAWGTPGTPTGPGWPELSACSRRGARECLCTE